MASSLSDRIDSFTDRTSCPWSRSARITPYARDRVGILAEQVGRTPCRKYSLVLFEFRYPILDHNRPSLTGTPTDYLPFSAIFSVGTQFDMWPAGWYNFRLESLGRTAIGGLISECYSHEGSDSWSYYFAGV